MNVAPSKVIRILGKFFLVESAILGFGIRVSALGILNPSTIEIRNPVYKIRNPRRRIRNPRLSWITLQGGVNETICVLYNKYISVVFWHRRHHQLLLSVYLTYPTHDTKKTPSPVFFTLILFFVSTRTGQSTHKR